MKIIKKFTFDSAHKLWNKQWDTPKNVEVYGKCTNLHGHTYKLEVVISGGNAESGMVMNFRDLSQIVKDSIIDRYDHAYLNELPEFLNTPTTSETIGQYIFDTLQPQLEAFEGVKVEEIRLSETPTSEAIIDSPSK